MEGPVQPCRPEAELVNLSHFSLLLSAKSILLSFKWVFIIQSGMGPAKNSLRPQKTKPFRSNNNVTENIILIIEEYREKKKNLKSGNRIHFNNSARNYINEGKIK